MFTTWSQEQARTVMRQINKRRARISLYMNIESEENYCYLLDGELRLVLQKEYGYDFYYLEVYESENLSGRSEVQVNNCNVVLKAQQKQSQQCCFINNNTPTDIHSLPPAQIYNRPIIKKMILPQCLFQINHSQLKIYFLESQTFSRTAMLRFQHQNWAQSYWKFICWVIGRQLQGDVVDPLKVLYLPNQKNLAFIVRNFQHMKSRIHNMLKQSTSDLYIHSLTQTIAKCIHVGDQHNLSLTHQLIQKILYCDDNLLIETLFRNQEMFFLIIKSFSHKRHQDLMSCYWDPILPLPLQRQHQLSTIVSQDFLLVVPLQVRQSICIIHRITFFRQFILQIKKRSQFESKLVQIVKYNNSLLIKYFTNGEIVRDLLMYDEDKWGLWRATEEGVDDRSWLVENRSQVYGRYSVDENGERVRYGSEWESMASRSLSQSPCQNTNITEAMIIKQDSVILMDLQNEQQQKQQKAAKQPANKISNLSPQQCIQIQDDNNSLCQIIEQRSIMNNNINSKSNIINNRIEIILQQQQRHNNKQHLEVVIDITPITIDDDSSGMVSNNNNHNHNKSQQLLLQSKQHYIEQHLKLSRQKLVKSFKPLLFWLIVTFTKTIQQQQVKQQAIAALFQSDILKYVFNTLRDSFKKDNQLSQQSSLNQSSSYNLIITQLHLQILISMAKYNHKKMIAYLNHHIKKQWSSMHNGWVTVDFGRKKQNNTNSNKEINPYKVLALAYWGYGSYVMDNQRQLSSYTLPQQQQQQIHKKILLFFQNLFPQLSTQQYIHTFFEQFVSCTLQHSIKYFTMSQIKIQQQSSLSNKIIPFHQARKRQLQLCLFIMRNLPHLRYSHFITGYLIKYVFPTFNLQHEHIQSEQPEEQYRLFYHRYSKQSKLLTFQFVNKCVEWVEFSRRERERHERRENEKEKRMFGMSRDQEDDSDFNVPLMGNIISSISSGSGNFLNSKKAGPLQHHIVNPLLPDPSSQPLLMSSNDLSVLQQSIQHLQQSLISSNLIYVMCRTLLQELKRKRENCIVGCGLEIMKRLKGLIPNHRITTNNISNKNSNLYQQPIVISNPNNYTNSNDTALSNQYLQKLHSRLFQWKSLLGQLKKDLQKNRTYNNNNKLYHMRDNVKNSEVKHSPVVRYMFSLLQNNPEWITIYIDRLPTLSQRQLFMSFYPSSTNSPNNLSLLPSSSQQNLSLQTSSEIQSSSVDSLSYYNDESSGGGYYKYRQESSGQRECEQQQEVRRRHLLSQGQIDQMYNRREQQSESQDQDEDQDEQENDQQEQLSNQQQHDEQKQQTSFPTSSPQSQQQYRIIKDTIQNNSNSSSSQSSSQSSSSSINNSNDNRNQQHQQMNSLLYERYTYMNGDNYLNRCALLSFESSSSGSLSSSESISSSSSSSSQQNLPQHAIHTRATQSVDRMIKLLDAKWESKLSSQYERQQQEHQQSQQHSQEHNSPHLQLRNDALINHNQILKYQLQQDSSTTRNRTYYHQASLHNLIKHRQQQQKPLNTYQDSAIPAHLQNKTLIEQQTLAQQEMTLGAFVDYQPTKHIPLQLSLVDHSISLSQKQKQSRVIYKVVDCSRLLQQPIDTSQSTSIQNPNLQFIQLQQESKIDQLQ